MGKKWRKCDFNKKVVTYDSKNKEFSIKYGTIKNKNFHFSLMRILSYTRLNFFFIFSYSSSPSRTFFSQVRIPPQNSLKQV